MKIDKGVSAPSAPGRVGRPKKYCFEDMEIGDSSLFTCGTSGPRKAADRCRRKTGMRFSSRVTDEGLRIWRIE